MKFGFASFHIFLFVPLYFFQLGTDKKTKVYVTEMLSYRIKIETCQAIMMRAAGGQSSDSESSIRRQERDRRLTFMVAVMYISFLAIWTPYALTSLLETAGYQPDSPLGYTLLAGEMKSV